ncbi:hypothetical protein P1J78_09300 [Psychromarinibacter sp. C21-152]|uniref:Uncharacterized protein n=1 Tax=Psychromarinibacter sediminicola TaxID=3033385 RepID=A0AAE3NRW1_9RHOB|nr:hypothetical protein [Psychromarinibacter sediminicola]MDF0600926.1 hypothetical protein [Psychromarinibacter sediminicola]
MDEDIRYDSSRRAWIISGADIDEGYRLIVPRELAEDELGGTPDDAECAAWLKAHLPQILQAYTARTEGGWMKAPWDRVLVDVVE